MFSNNFKREEFQCTCGCGHNVVDAELINVLEEVRAHFDAPVIITSGCRCPTQNRIVGGSQFSQHIKGKAADFKVDDVAEKKVADYLEKTYKGKYGIGRYKGRTHIDVRDGDAARWKG